MRRVCFTIEKNTLQPAVDKIPPRFACLRSGRPDYFKKEEMTKGLQQNFATAPFSLFCLYRCTTRLLKQE